MGGLFDKINNSSKEKLLKILEATTLTFPRNTNVFSAIKDSNSIGIIEYGSLQVIRNDYNGCRNIIEELEDNDIFGSIIYPVSEQEYERQIRQKIKPILYFFIYLLKIY